MRRLRYPRYAADGLLAKQLQIESPVEEFRYSVEEALRLRGRPAPVFAVSPELRLDVGTRQRFLGAAANMRLALLHHRSVVQRGADVPGIRLRVRIVWIYHVAHLAGERENTRILHHLLGKGGKT